jgi:3-oxoacyl-[acyl-carrier protein] reductase
MGEFEGKTAIITGASRGIGRGIATHLGGLGANIVATARNTAALDSLVAELGNSGTRALAITADLSSEEDIQRIPSEALAEFGRIDILVNNGAIIHPRLHLVDFNIALWKEVIAINLVAAAILTRAVLPSMIENRQGKVINISSIGGRKGSKGRSAYRAAKAGLISLTESVAAEVKPFGIDVNCICPGGVDTEGLREAFGENISTEERDLMDVSEIAHVAAFLASNSSSAITGTAIDAFGGGNPLFR